MDNQNLWSITNNKHNFNLFWQNELGGGEEI
jgi:hypothetical protein